MITNKLDLINEQTSPLFRIMWVQNFLDPARRAFDNNICAFHTGNGIIISVAHNLRSESQVLKIIPDAVYETDILPHLNPTQVQLFDNCYLHDSSMQKRYVNITNQADGPLLIDVFRQINFDTRWLTLTQRSLSKPFLIIQFRSEQFYDDPTLTGHFTADVHFAEPSLDRHTFLLELELVNAFYNEDIAIYRIINTNQAIINRLPNITIDFGLLDDTQSNLYCLQSSPNGNLGRLLNKAIIEGHIDHHGTFQDRIGGNYIFEGLRYLIRGYFRFGSSGAPYIFQDSATGIFKVNAVQSEASPIQLSIKNDRDGNFQYVNAIASPLSIVRERILSHLPAEQLENGHL